MYSKMMVIKPFFNCQIKDPIWEFLSVGCVNHRNENVLLGAIYHQVKKVQEKSGLHTGIAFKLELIAKGDGIPSCEKKNVHVLCNLMCKYVSMYTNVCLYKS